MLQEQEEPMAGMAGDGPSPEITILLPCLDEAETLLACIREAQAALVAAGVEGEVLVADNGSRDGSPELAQAAQARVVVVARRGYGSALLGGIAAARAPWVLMGDADGSYDFGELERFLAELRRGADLVMGCRLPGGGGRILPGAMPWPHRWLGNPVLSALGRLLFAVPVRDFHCGLRAFRREAVLGLGLCCPGMELASEMVVKARLHGLIIREVPVTLRPDGRSRPPHLRSWRDGWRHLRLLLLLSPRWLFLVPGLCLALPSLLVFLRLWQAPLALGGLVLDTNTLIVAAAGLTAGVQVSLLGLLARVLAVELGLLPSGRMVERLRRLPAIELGLALGGLLVLAGLGYLLLAVERWREAGFGPLSYPVSLRTVVPAVTAMALGIQLAFSGCALAVLSLGREIRLRRADP